MAQPDFTVRQGDDFTISDTLQDANGNAVDIQGATVKFTMVPIGGGTAKINAATASNDQNSNGSDGSKGKVHYTGTTTNSDTAGWFLGSWTVTFAGPQTQTYPNSGYILIQVSPDAPTSVGLNYITTEELKSARELTDYSYADADIERAISSACRAIDNTCRRRFYLDADATSVRLYTPDDPRRLLIDDIVVITSVQTDNNGDGVYEYTWTAGSDYSKEPANAAADYWPYTTLVQRINGSYWFPTMYENSVKVTGQFGWPVIPDPIKQAALSLAVRYLSRAREAPFGVLAVGGPIEGTAFRISKADPDVYDLLRPYVKARILM